MLDKYGPVLWTALALIAVYAAKTLRRWRYMRFEQFAGFPQLGKSSFILGHIALIGKLVGKGDPRRHIDQVFLEVCREQGGPPVLLVDLRPILYPMLVICSPEVAEQITKPSAKWSSSTPKSPTLKDFWALTGKDSILTKEGEDWKVQRKRLSPGFAPQNLLTTLPIIVEKIKYLLGHLDRFAATGSEFSLDQLLTALTFDIIGAVTMGQDLKAQIPGEESELLTAYKDLAALYQGRSAPSIPGTKWLRKRKQAQLAARIERLTKAIVRHEFANAGQQQQASRSVLGLSLQGTEALTDELVQQTSDNLRVFMFAGHDTTSILMQWVFYELTRSPRARAALCAELDALFGADDVDPAAVGARLIGPEGAELLGAMTYGAAVVKETLRLHPPAATARMAPPGSDARLTLPGGKSICPDGCVMYVNSYVIQHDARVWGEDVDDFVPERWLGDTGAVLQTGGWRPFERGPRSCIGLELANIEAKVILALAARRYDFVKVGLGELELDGEGRPVEDEKGYYKTKSALFNCSQVTSKPVDGTMMKVKLNQ
ncbi:unnamed protein product [Discula destructiva]